MKKNFHHVHLCRIYKLQFNRVKENKMFNKKCALSGQLCGQNWILTLISNFSVFTIYCLKIAEKWGGGNTCVCQRMRYLVVAGIACTLFKYSIYCFTLLWSNSFENIPSMRKTKHRMHWGWWLTPSWFRKHSYFDLVFMRIANQAHDQWEMTH